MQCDPPPLEVSKAWRKEERRLERKARERGREQAGREAAPVFAFQEKRLQQAMSTATSLGLPPGLVRPVA